MDRSQALDILDALPPMSPAENPEVAEALRVLEADPEGRRQLELRRSLNSGDPFDREIARAMCQVPVPAGARQRLLDRLAAETPAPETPAPESQEAQGESEPEALPLRAVAKPAAESPPPVQSHHVPPSSKRSRRRALWKAVSVGVVVLLAAVAVWQFRQVPRVPFEVVLQTSVPIDVPTLPPLGEGSFKPRLPDGWEDRLLYDAAPDGSPQFRRLLVGPDGTTEAGACAFSVWFRGRVAADGYLLVVPSRSVANPPPETSFATAPDLYSGALALRAWTAGDQVFVCVVRGGEAGLHALKRALDIRFM